MDSINARLRLMKYGERVWGLVNEDGGYGENVGPAYLSVMTWPKINVFFFLSE